MRLFARIICGACIAVVGLSAGCGQNPPDRPADGRTEAFAGIPPAAYLVEQVGGRHVRVEVLVEPGQDPHSFQPTPRQVSALSRAGMFFRVGMPFENALVEKLRRGNPRMKIVDCAAGVEKRTMDQSRGRSDHDHSGHDGMTDPHVWLSPALLKVLASNVSAALAEADPEHAEDFRRNLKELRRRIDAADERIEKKLAPYRGRTFFVFHPSFGYFADAYGLKQEAISPGGHAPTPKQLQALIELARAAGAGAIFVQPQFDPHGPRTVAEAVDARLVEIDPMAKDVLRTMEDFAEKLEQGFSEYNRRSSAKLNQ